MYFKIKTNHEISPDIIDLIIKAEKQIDIISPYLDLWNHLQSNLEAAAKRDVIINVVFRAEMKDKYKDITKWLMDIGAHVYMVDKLHTKVYCSERTVIITSMNLYDYSAKNSEEFALTSPEDELIEQTQKYIAELRSRAIPLDTKKVGRVFDSVGKKETVASTSRSRSAASSEKHSAAKASAASESSAARTPKVSARGEAGAFCVRCGEDLKFNMEKPLCYNCFKSWSKYKNPAFVEKFCHGCGKAHKSSLEKPLCMPCWKDRGRPTA
ncbi:MAG: phospholipase D-like domain-containing protein [bacterium]